MALRASAVQSEIGQPFIFVRKKKKKKKLVSFGVVVDDDDDLTIVTISE